MDSRTDVVRTILHLVVVPGLLLAGLTVTARGQESGDPQPGPDAVRERVNRGDTGHGMPGAKRQDTSKLSREARMRIGKLEARITCACPNENWSKTLAHCPDACADPQKGEVLEGVLRGDTDAKILQDQRDRYGPRVLAQPGWGDGGWWTYVLPMVICVVAAVLTVAVLSVLVRRRGRSDAAEPEAAMDGVSDTELAAIEQELAELED